jgi:hypothetical protein
MDKYISLYAKETDKVSNFSTFLAFEIYDEYNLRIADDVDVIDVEGKASVDYRVSGKIRFFHIVSYEIIGGRLILKGEN